MSVRETRSGYGLCLEEAFGGQFTAGRTPVPVHSPAGLPLLTRSRRRRMILRWYSPKLCIGYRADIQPDSRCSIRCG